MRPTSCSGRRSQRLGTKTRSNKLPVAPIIDDGYNLGMPSARLTIIVRQDQAASLDRLEDLCEERRTLIGTDVSVLLTAADDPAATKLFTDLGALAIPFEATAMIGDIHYLVAGDGNQMSVVEAWASTPAGLQDSPRRADGSWTHTACGNVFWASVVAPPWRTGLLLFLAPPTRSSRF